MEGTSVLGSSVSAGVATLLSPGLPWQGMSHVSITAGRLHTVELMPP